MACPGTDTDVLTRISGRTGSKLRLNVTFYKNGIPTEPFAIRRVDIYRTSVQDENLLAQFPMLYPDETGYPSPVTRDIDEDDNILPGQFSLIWDVPEDLPAPEIYFDVWNYIPEEPEGWDSWSAEEKEAFLDDEDNWKRCCNEFWLQPNSTYCDSDLSTIRLGFEALDVKFHKPEIRNLEVGLMPLPLYDYDYNKIAPILPRLCATLTIFTENCEVLEDFQDIPMDIGLRQGSYRTNPFVLKTKIDTSMLLRGTYLYQIEVELPNGETRVSPRFNLTVG